MLHRRHVGRAAALGLALAASGAPAAAEAQDLVDVAASNGQFDTLVGALKETGLDEALRGPGPFTVFAPTDAAFAELSDEEQRVLLNPENRDPLDNVLLFHVVEGEVTSEQIEGRAVLVDTRSGNPLAIDGTATPINVGGAPLEAADIEADNGVIHVVDEVILPPAMAR
ncbi:MAG: fasciclin domain-containing protein [Alphaproteobacteria bacterium]